MEDIDYGMDAAMPEIPNLDVYSPNASRTSLADGIDQVVSGIRTIRIKQGPVVDKTVDIEGELPNAIYTLIPSTIVAILKAASVPEDCHFICHKFLRVLNAHRKSRKALKQGGTYVTLDDGRVYTRGNNLGGRCGVGHPDAHLSVDHWVRLPPVKDLRLGLRGL